MGSAVGLLLAELAFREARRQLFERLSGSPIEDEHLAQAELTMVL